MIDYAFLDSGTGGIPYLAALRQKSPDSSVIYVADTANFPYGEKNHQQVVSCALDVCRKIIEKFSPKVIVIACNTISVNSLDMLREAFPDTLFVGTVPAIKVAGDISEKRCIGLLATNSTINHPYNQDLKNHFAADCKMVLRGDPDLISFVEHKSFTATQEERKNACKEAVDFFRNEGCDVIILGCTHFLNIKEEIQDVAGDIKVVDSVEGVTNRALSLRGVAGKPGCPAGEGGEQRSANQGEASPSHTPSRSCCIRNELDEGEASPSHTPALFITGFCDKKDKKEYDVICKRHQLSFGGIL